MPWAESPGSSPCVSVCSLHWDGYTQKEESIPREAVAKGLESRRTSFLGEGLCVCYSEDSLEPGRDGQGRLL